MRRISDSWLNFFKVQWITGLLVYGFTLIILMWFLYHLKEVLQ